jgi:hypothetical protein
MFHIILSDSAALSLINLGTGITNERRSMHRIILDTRRRINHVLRHLCELQPELIPISREEVSDDVDPGQHGCKIYRNVFALRTKALKDRKIARGEKKEFEGNG